MNRFLIAFAFVFALAPLAHASEVFGTVSTPYVSTGISGTVVASPTASPDSGTYSGTQSVTLSAPGSSSIHYFLNTTDLNSALTCSSGTMYTTPITVNGSGLLRAIACYGSTASPIASFSYTISTATTPAPSSGGNSGGNSGGSGGGGGGGSITTTTTTNTGSSLIGDINGDGAVDILDFNALLVQWGQSGANLAADLNHDNIVDILDFNILIIHLAS
ncbi:MAG: chitobiase/beta-hexosaminidase C-terminal domain-containing protein [Minisyncoccota bacterium]